MSRAASAEHAAEQELRRIEAGAGRMQMLFEDAKLFLQIVTVCGSLLGLLWTFVLGPMQDRQQRTDDRLIVIVEKLGRMGGQVQDVWQWQREHRR